MYMKNTVILAVLAFLAAAPAAYADGSSANAGSLSTASSGSASSSKSVANSDSGAASNASSGVNANQGQNSTMNLNQTAAKIPNNTPDVFAPQVNNTAPCMRSVAGGVSAAGFGLAFGAGDEDEDCNMRENVILLHNIGRDELAMQYYCDNEPKIRAAADKLGVPCPLPPRVVSAQATEQAPDDSSWFNPADYRDLGSCLINAEPRSSSFVKKANMCQAHTFPRTAPSKHYKPSSRH